MCIPESETAYAIEAGSTSSSCTKQEPCTLERAIAVTDTTRTNVRLLSDLNPNAVIQLNSSDSLPEKLSIFGDHATTVPAFSLSSSTGTFVVRDVALAESYGIECSVGDPAKPNTLIDVARSTLYGLFGARCDIVLNGVTVIRGADTAISLSGGARLTMDRSEVIGGSPSIALFDSSEVQITNSIIRDPVNGAAFAFSAEALQSSVSFTTFYNAHWSCSDGPVVFAASNNVFLYEKAGAPANVVSGTQCRHTYSLIKPQSATPNGSNNLLNMDPRFVNGAGGDFHLIAGSPVIDAADPAATNAVDFEGTARPQGAGRDLGAFEYKP